MIIILLAQYEKFATHTCISFPQRERIAKCYERHWTGRVLRAKSEDVAVLVSIRQESCIWLHSALEGDDTIVAFGIL